MTQEHFLQIMLWVAILAISLAVMLLSVAVRLLARAISLMHRYVGEMSANERLADRKEKD